MHSLERLGTDELANIFGFLPPKDIMWARLNKRMVEAAKKTIVPITDFRVDSVRKYNALVAMSTALPNLQQISLGHHRNLYGHKYSDGEDRDEEWAAHRANFITHDIEIISRFRKLRSLELVLTPLNGRYPFLFSFPLLHKLNITMCHHLKWNLEMLAGLPLLKELNCNDNDFLTGNLNSLSVLKDTLTKVTIMDCSNVQGNFMDLADFPHLKKVYLDETGVTGDIRDIGKQDFQTLESLTLPSGVYGGMCYEFQHISDAPDLAMAVYSIYKQRPTLLEKWCAMLSEHSPDWYDGIGSYDVYESTAPLCIRLVQAGSRVGYRWESVDSQHPCEVIWLDPEPQRESIDYEIYIEAFQEIQLQINIYRGFHQPPTEEEHNLLWASEGYID